MEPLAFPPPLLAPERARSRQGPRLIAVRRADGALRDTAMHRHARGQLLGAYQGLLTVYAGEQQWVVPSMHAVWIPPDHPHGLRSHGPYAGYSAYLSPAACAGLPASPCLLRASALLVAAVDRAAAWEDGAPDTARRHIEALIREEIRTRPRAGAALVLLVLSVNLLEVRNLRVEFPTRRGTLRALDDVSFSIQAGEVLGVVGESGAGKSLTGASIIGLLEPPGRIAAGEILLAGRRIDNLPDEQMRRVRGREIGAVWRKPSSRTWT
ncbi:hypothetical protein G6F57_016824 [Rhizopus arrhizus]|nr:hypothetical protein G6F57_016824 [Rhizopus arrhizus]